MTNAWGQSNNINKIQWVLDNPDFRFKPATMLEFLGPGYLNLDHAQNPNLDKRVVVRPGLKKALIDVFGDEIDPERLSKVRRSMMTGGIGIGKTTFAAIAMSYMVHWVSCLIEPQKHFGLQPGTRIAFMLMSTKGSQTSEVLFSDIKAKIANCEWFEKYAPYNADDKKRVNQLRFAKDIWIIPGNSSEKTFEGYNILGGIVDEGDSHKVTEEKDYAEEGYNTIENRISSRFDDPIRGDHRGLIMVIGQMKKADGFMARKKKEFLDDITDSERTKKLCTSHFMQMTIWESHGWERYRDPKTGKIDVFYYDVNRRKIVPPGPASQLNSPNIMKIPAAYRKLFEKDPVKALRDQAGIPPQVEDPFIAMTDRVDGCFDRYAEHHPDLLVPVTSSPFRPDFHPDFGNPGFGEGLLKRVVHVDIGYAAHGDAGALAMGYIKEVVDIDGEWKPYIVIDMMMRMMPRGGEDLMLKSFRDKIVEMRDEYKYRIGVVSYDGFQSVESQQILRSQYKFNVAETSVDRSKGPYEDLREAINEQRIEFPKYMTLLKRDDTEKTCVVRKELLELTDVGRKIDHPPRGSKDIADCLAAVTHILMGNKVYRRGAKKADRGAKGDGELNFEGYAVSQEKSGRTLQPVSLSGKSKDQRLLEGLLGAKTGPNGLPPLEDSPFGDIGRPRMS
jgi:hypothetical protein